MKTLIARHFCFIDFALIDAALFVLPSVDYRRRCADRGTACAQEEDADWLTLNPVIERL